MRTTGHAPPPLRRPQTQDMWGLAGTSARLADPGGLFLAISFDGLAGERRCASRLYHRDLLPPARLPAHQIEHSITSARPGPPCFAFARTVLSLVCIYHSVPCCALNVQHSLTGFGWTLAYLTDELMLTHLHLSQSLPLPTCNNWLYHAVPFFSPQPATPLQQAYP